MAKTSVERTTAYRQRQLADPVKREIQLAKEAAYRRRLRTEHPEKYKKTFQFHNAKRKVGVKTREEFDQLLTITMCNICGGKATVIDHCHTTGRIRSRLCANCNSGLGFFSDDVVRLAKAIEYLDYHAKIK